MFAIDNFDILVPLLNFESDDDFYYLQLLQRKKENEDLGANSRVIRNYYLRSVDHLMKRKREIIEICDVTKARAMLRLNKRSFEKTAYKAMQNLANTMSNREYAFCHKSYDRAVGQGNNETHKRWIIDIDNNSNRRAVNEMVVFIENGCDPTGKKFICTVPSRNGLHIIVTPFNMETFRKMYPDVDVHKDNPTNLYIPAL